VPGTRKIAKVAKVANTRTEGRLAILNPDGTDFAFGTCPLSDAHTVIVPQSQASRTVPGRRLAVDSPTLNHFTVLDGILL
jgi:hypothetical protein